MKTLSDQIAVMQHVENGGSIVIKNLEGSVNQIILNPTYIAFNWSSLDYDIYDIPENFWFKILNAQGEALAFATKEDYIADTSASVKKGRYFKLGALEIKLLTENNLIPEEQ